MSAKMTENAAALARQQGDNKAWSKYKWRGKKPASNEEATSREKDRNFTLNDDVVDFLKPSTNKARTPRSSVDATKGWPGAAGANGVGPDTDTSLLVSGRPNPRRARRPNLRVDFVKTNPEIIGEGGDDAELPAIAISAARGHSARPQLEGHQNSQDDSAVGLQSADDYTGSKGRSFDVVDNNFRPTPVRRAQTSFGETSPSKPTRRDRASQASCHSIPKQELEFRPSPLKRAPTGWEGIQDDLGRSSMESEGVRSDPFNTPARLDRTGNSSMQTSHPQEMGLSFDHSPVKRKKVLGGTSPNEPTNPGSYAARMQQIMRAEEGQALHQGARRPSQTLSDDAPRLSVDAPRPSTSGSNSYRMPSPQLDVYNSLASSSLTSEPQSRVTSFSRSSHQEHAPSAKHLSSSPSHPIAIAHRSAAPPRKRLPSPPAAYPDHDSSNNSSLRPTPSPGAIPPGTPNYFGLPSSGFEQYQKSPASLLDPDSALRTESVLSHRPAPHAPGDAAIDDFAERIIHMNGIFRLTAEVEKPLAAYTPMQWLRASIWWFLRGRAGLEVIIRNQPRGSDSRRASMQYEQPLSQPHVDLAKAWWILSEVLHMHPAIRVYDESGSRSQAAAARDAGDQEMAEILDVADVVTANLKGLAVSMSRNRVMPPQQSLIQGQDQSIWLSYPNFAPDVRSILSGQTNRSLTVSDSTRIPNPLVLLPLSDNKDDFCYGRVFVQVSLATDDENTDRVSLPCVLSILRGRNDWHLKVTICSQSELINICISGDRKLGPTWQEVQWRTRHHGLYVQLPRGFTLNVGLSESDYKHLWGIYDYTRKVETSLLPKDGELPVYEATLKDFQYSNPANPKDFPADRVKRCRVRVFEQSIQYTQGGGQQRCHRGYRLLIVTSPKHKTLSNISELIGRQRPIDISLVTDSDSDGSPAMLIGIPVDKAQSTMALTFNHQDERNALYCALIAIKPGPDEHMPAQLPLKGLSIEQADQADGFTQSAANPLTRLHWKDIQVINSTSDGLTTSQARTELSEHLRAVARCSGGSVTDRMNLGPGELRLRLDPSGSANLSILRAPQHDMTISVDSRRTEPGMPDALAELLQTIMAASTVRTYCFHSLNDLHAFETAITGFNVKFDGVAATFAIARRRMVVPIYKRWEAQDVRVQIVQQESVVQLLAFFEEFSHAEAMSFQLKSVDVFEKADRGGRFGVRLVDAKFALPGREERRTEGRFVCLDLLEYPGEHDDITVVFEGEGDRDRFLEALPAAAQPSRLITFKRKI